MGCAKPTVLNRQSGVVEVAAEVFGVDLLLASDIQHTLTRIQCMLLLKAKFVQLDQREEASFTQAFSIRMQRANTQWVWIV